VPPPAEHAATLNVLANDSDADGTLNPASSRWHAAGFRTATVNTTTGAITYAPPPLLRHGVLYLHGEGQRGATSNGATVTVNVRR